MDSGRIIRHAARAGAAFTWAGAAIGVANLTGTLPAALFGARPVMSSGKTVGLLPIEFFAAAYFTAVLIANGRTARAASRTVSMTTCVTAAVVAGGAAYLLKRTTVTWPMIASVAAAALIMGVSALEKTGWPGRLAEVWADLGLMRRSPRARTSVAVLVAVLAVLGAAAHVAIARTPTAVARERNLQRWYLASATSEQPVEIIAFNSYPWQPFPSTIVDRAAQADWYRRNGLAVRFSTREFPLDPACNTLRGSVIVTDAGCEAAYATKYVQTTSGDAAGAELASWLRARTTLLSKALVRHRLQQLSLLDGFLANYDHMRRLVADDIALARRFHVRTAPSYVINGVPIPGTEVAFDSILELEAKRHGAPARRPASLFRAGGGGGSASQPVVSVSIGDAATLGASAAPLVLVEFADFECRVCARFAAEGLPRLKQRYIDTGRVQLAVLQLPLPQLRRAALRAAQAAECARQHGRFWPLHDAFYRQASLDDNLVRSVTMAATGPALAPQIDACMNDPRTLARIADDAAIANLLHVRGTPTFAIGYREPDRTVRVVRQVSGADALNTIEPVLDGLLHSLERGGTQ